MLLRADKRRFLPLLFSGTTLDRMFSAGFSAGFVAGFSAGCSGFFCRLTLQRLKSRRKLLRSGLQRGRWTSPKYQHSTEPDASTGATSLASDEGSGKCAILTI